ncbi:DNA-binding protein, partial [Kitasatospora sp. NPDC001664]
LATKFTQGAWLAVLAAAALWMMMRGIRRHYDSVAAELTVEDPRAESGRPSKVHAIVLVSKLHKPTLRALSYAQAFRPDTLEALTVEVEKESTDELRAQWDAFGIEVPLKALNSPYREITKPVTAYVRSVRRTSPRDAVAVFIPEYVVGHWWETLLHNQSALWLKSRLLFTPGVMVISVPWQLSSAPRADRPARRAPGSVRRGEPAKAEDVQASEKI